MDLCTRYNEVFLGDKVKTHMRLFCGQAYGTYECAVSCTSTMHCSVTFRDSYCCLYCMVNHVCNPKYDDKASCLEYYKTLLQRKGIQGNGTIT